MTLSASITVYRLQAEFSDGANDGKIGMPRHEMVVFQMLTRAGDHRVGVTRALPQFGTVRRHWEVGDLGRNWQLLGSPRSYRFREYVLERTGLVGPSAQPALVIALSERHTPRAQDVICGDGVEIEVGQRKRKDESL